MKNTIKKICKLILICMLCLALSVSFCLQTAASSEFTGRSDFVWGVNGHNQTYKSYPIRTLDQQIKLAAELGVGIYRFNYNPKNGNDYSYLDRVVNLVERYGMKMLLVLDDFADTPDIIQSRCETIAKRYNGKNGYGKIEYIQVFNEVDVWAMTTKDFSDTGNRKSGDGTVASHYSQMALANVLPKFKAGVSGVRAGNPNCKVIINISYMHTYLFDYLKANGVTWDLTGLDWYQDMYEKQDGYTKILARLSERYSQDIIICETNIWPFTAQKESEYENDTSFLPQIMHEVYDNYSRVKGMIFYELLDEPQFEMQKGSYEGESHFGLVKVSREDFSIGEKKPIYNRIQQMLGGGAKEPAPASDTSSSAGQTTKPTSSAQTASTVSPVESPSVSQNSEDTSSDAELKSDASSEVSSTVSSESDNSAKKSKKSFSLAVIIVIVIAAVAVTAAAVFIVLKNRAKKSLSSEEGITAPSDDTDNR